MNPLHERIEARLRERIEAAEAALPDRGKLDLKPLFSHLDDVIRVVESIRDYSVEPYLDRVREVVCPACRQDDKGCCATRENNLCGLDKHFKLIVSTIEQELKAG